MSGLKIEKFATVSAFALFAAPGIASAQCVTDAQGDTLCTGSTTTPQRIENGTGEEHVIVQSGASIVTSLSGASPLHVRAFTADVTNNGTIQTSAGYPFGGRPGIAAVLFESGVIPSGADTSNALISFTNNGQITATGTTPFATGGVYGITGVGDVNLVNASGATIDATNFGMVAITLHDGGEATVINNGSITAGGRGLLADARGVGSTAIAENHGTLTSPDRAVGVALSAGTTGIGRNTGTINLTGSVYGAGIDVGGFAVDLDVTGENSGSISGSGSNQYGIGALVPEGADIALRNLAGGAITLSGDDAYGIWADVVFSNLGTAGGTIDILNAGGIEVTGDGARGINVFTDTSVTADIENAATGSIDATDFAIRLESTGAAASVVNAGDLTAEGTALFADVTGGDITISNTGTILDTTSGGAAINAQSDQDVSIDNDGVVTAQSDLSTAILAASSGGDLTFNNGVNGDISVDDADSALVSLSTDAGQMAFANAGVMTTAAGSRSVYLYVEGGGLQFDNSGTIETGDSNAVIAEVDNGNATFENAGAVRAGSGADAYYIETYSPGAVTFTNAGIISTTGVALRTNLAGGSLAFTNSGRVTGDLILTGVSSATVTNEANGSLSGDGFGVQLISSNGDASFSNAGSIQADGTALLANVTGGAITISNTGSIVDNGSGGAAISAQSDSDITIDTNGSVTTQSDFSTALFATTSGGDVSFTNGADGVITVNDSDSAAVSLYALDGDMAFANAGAVTTAAGSNSVYLYVEGGDLQLDNSGAIDTADAAGIVAEVDSGNATVTNTGDVRAGSGADGFSLETYSSGSVSFDNSGVISTTGAAIRLDLAGGALSLTNSGQITGDVILTNSTDSLTHTGALTGAISFGAGNDEMQVSGASATIAGDIDGGDGFDQIIFDQTDGFLFEDRISNVEQLSVSGGRVVFQGATVVGATDVQVASTGELDLEGGGATVDATTFTNAGEVDIAPGAELTVQNGDYIATAGSTTRFGLENGNGRLMAEGNITFEAGSQIEIDARDQNLLVNGTSFDAAEAGGALTDASGDLIDNSALFDFVKEVVDGDTLRILVQRALDIQQVAAPGDPNGSGLAAAIQSYIESGTPDGDRLSTLLGQIPDDAGLAAALDGLKLDSSNGMQMSQLELASDLLRARDRAARPEAGTSEVWASVIAGSSSLDPDAFANGAEDSRVSGIAGVNLGLGDGRTVVGGAIAYSVLESREQAARTYRSGATATSLMGYVSHDVGSWGIHGDIGYSGYSVDTKRFVPILNEFARAEFDASSLFGQLEVNKDLEVGANWSVSPFGRMQFVALDLPSYIETGSIVSAAVEREDAQSVRAELGARAGRVFAETGAGIWSFNGYGALGQEFGDIEGHYVSSIGSAPAFLVQTARPERFGVDVGLELNLLTNLGTKIGIAYDGVFRSNAQDHATAVRISREF